MSFFYEYIWPRYLIRNHVHFSAGEPGEDGVISGMRKSAGLNIPPKCHTWIKRIGTISRVRNHIFDIRLRNNSLVEEKLNMELFEFFDVNIKHLHPSAEPQLMTLKSGWAKMRRCEKLPFLTIASFRPENLHWHAQSNGFRFEVSLKMKISLSPDSDKKSWLPILIKILTPDSDQNFDLPDSDQNCGKPNANQLLNCVHFRFFRSANNVILSPGDANGVVKTDFFSKVKNVKTNQIIFGN